MPPITYITLDPPYRLDAEDETFVFVGWAEVDDEEAPNVRLTVNGVEAPVFTQPRPGIQKHFPGLRALGLHAKVRFPELLRGQPAPREPFLLEATVISDERRRTFEYEVTEAWLENVFGRRLRARRIPPEALQIRVTGAAAGEFHATGRAVARQIAGLLDGVGAPLQSHRRILDFGCGPGRVVSSIRDVHPRARLFGVDIDAEAIAWAAANLGDVADFRPSGAEPPLPFPDEAFDLIYGVSVFTHLPEDMQHAWLTELRRVLRPGGLVVTTKLDPAAYDLPPEVQAAAREHGFVYWGEAPSTDGLPGFYRLAYHTADYVRREWGRGFEVLHVGAHDLNDTQDAVILRRPRDWRPAWLRR